MSAANLPALPRPAADAPAASRQANFQRAIVEEVAAAVAAHPVVVVGMAWNPHVPRARRALAQAGVKEHYLQYGSYLSGWRQRLALKIWAGWPTFPQVYVKGQLVGGADEIEAMIQSGELARRLQG